MQIHSYSLDKHIQLAQEAIASAEAIKSSGFLNLPIEGVFVFNWDGSCRIVVESLEELHNARRVLQDNFGWNDKLTQNFGCLGRINFVYEPTQNVNMPFKLELWLSCKPKEIPKELLGDCRVVERVTTEYSIVCDTGA